MFIGHLLFITKRERSGPPQNSSRPGSAVSSKMLKIGSQEMVLVLGLQNKTTNNLCEITLESIECG